MKNIGMYIHIPFCIRKCDYCDFYSCDNKSNLISSYIWCLKQEIKEVGRNIGNSFIIDTIYIGGGTPSYIESNYMVEVFEEIYKYFKLDENIEITIEINPGTANKIKLNTYKKLGINRCSIGLQSTNDTLLHNIGRIHNLRDFMDTYNIAKEVRI